MRLSWSLPRPLLTSLFAALPSSITDLKCLEDIENLGFTWSALTSHFPHLASIEIENVIDIPRRLPSTLTKLQLKTEKFDLFLDCLQESSLVDLTLQLFGSLEESWQGVILFKHFPRTLERFHLITEQSISWTPDAWSALPHTLHTLEILGHINPPQSSKTLPYMPPNLTKLCLTLDPNDTLTKSDISAMLCYNKLRYLESVSRRRRGLTVEDKVHDSWPEASILPSLFPSYDLVMRDLHYPDPRVGASSSQVQMPSTYVLALDYVHVFLERDFVESTSSSP